MFWTPRHGEVRGVPGPSEGTFFTFFRGAVRAPNPFPALATRGGGHGWGSRSGIANLGHDRERIREAASSFVITSIVEHSLAFRTRRCAIGDRAEHAQAGSSWHKDNHGIDSDHGSILSTPPHDLRSLGAIANFVRRSRTLFASSIDPSITSRSSPTSQARSRSLALTSLAVRSNPFDRKHSRARSEKNSSDRIDELSCSRSNFSCICPLFRPKKCPFDPSPD
jgi:hypothetical protein